MKILSNRMLELTHEDIENIKGKVRPNRHKNKNSFENAIDNAIKEMHEEAKEQS